MLDAEPALEQQRHRRVPDPFVGVVGGDAAQRAVAVADPVDDRGEDVGEFGADDQQPFGVGLRRCDLQQRDGFTGAGQGVVDEAVMGQFGELLDTDPGVPQRLHRGPGPERPVLLAGQVAALPGGWGRSAQIRAVRWR